MNPTRESKRRRLDVASLLNPPTDTHNPEPPQLCEATSSMQEPRQQPDIPSLLSSLMAPPSESAPFTEANSTAQNSRNSVCPKLTEPFPIFGPAKPREKKRKAEDLATVIPAELVESGLVVGTSRSARTARTQNEQVADGTFVIDNRKLLQFKRKIRLVDPGAGFMVEGNVKRVMHSLCGKDFTMKQPYNTGHFTRHVGTCTGPPKTIRGRKNTSAPTPPGTGIFRFLVPKNQTIMPPQSLPCPGLTKSQHERIPIYLSRSSAPGGGVTSRTIVARKIYSGHKYSQLTRVQKANVRRIQVLQFRWINDHHEERVVSAKCLKMVATKAGLEEAEPCVECVALLRLGTLRSVLSRPIPDDKNLKYIPKECLSTLVGKLYVTFLGLREIMESQVCIFLSLLQKIGLTGDRITHVSSMQRVYLQGSIQVLCCPE